LRMPPVSVPPTSAVAVAPLPAGSVIVTVGSA